MDNAILLLEQITESIEDLLPRANLSSEDLARFCAISNQNRRKEWLKSRVMVWERFGKRIHTLPSGAPSIEEGFISISHCDDANVAVLYAEHGKCGIDIELRSRDVSRIVRKFASEPEVEQARIAFAENPELLIWCAKEALYKYCGVEGAEFTSDFQITKTTESEIKAVAFGATKVLRHLCQGELLIVYIS